MSNTGKPYPTMRNTQVTGRRRTVGDVLPDTISGRSEESNTSDKGPCHLGAVIYRAQRVAGPAAAPAQRSCDGRVEAGGSGAARRCATDLPKV